MKTARWADMSNPDRTRNKTMKVAVSMYRIISGILALIESGTTGMSADEIIENGLAMFWKR